MEKNIEAAVEAYSGNIPMGLFVDKLPRNLRNLNRTFEEIKEIFDASAINNFEKLPEEPSEKRKFAKAFNQFDTYLQRRLRYRASTGNSECILLKMERISRCYSMK